MATIAPVITQLESLNGHTHSISWPSMANGDVGAEVSMSGAADRSVQISGTFGVGGSMTLEGNNEGTGVGPAGVSTANFVALHDAQGSALTMTSAKIDIVSEPTRFVRPHVTAGDGTTALTVTMLVRRPR